MDTMEQDTLTILEKNSPQKTGGAFVRDTFPVTGMTCAGCAASVASILNDTEGVKQADANFASSSVLVEYDQSLSPTDLRNPLQSVGYDLIVDDENPQEKQRELQ